MSQSHVFEHTHEQPQAVYLKDYQVPVYFIDEINLHFDLHDDFARVKSSMRIRHNRQSSSAEHDLILDGDELTLESIQIDGESLAAHQYRLTNETLTLFSVPDSFNLEIVTKILPQKNTALSGLYRSANTFCTQCEAQGFRRITYYQDHPDILARFTTTIVADAKKYPFLLSNGNLIDGGKLESGRHWAKWEDPFKKPSYLFALVAGDFDLISDTFTTQSGRVVDLRIYVEKGYGEQAHHAMHALKEAMRWDEAAYGREYDLDIYMIVAIGDFNMGAMENKGLNIFNTKYILAKPETATDQDYINIMSVVGHEYFHNWSGNRVTCRDWFQLSLKEGLTIFRDQSFTEDTLSRAVMRIHDVVSLRETQFPEDAGPLAHPVRPDAYIEINNFYTATIYNKGAEVLRMMQTILGKSLFRKGMDLYFARHDGQAVTIDDFVNIMQDISGINLTQFRLWYSQAGTPQVEVLDHYDAERQVYTLTFQQSCQPTPGQPHKKPFFIPVAMSLLDRNGLPLPMELGNEPAQTEKVLHLTEAHQMFVFKNMPSRPVPSLLRGFSAPVKLHYAYTEEELQFLFKHDTDPFNRWEAGQKYAVSLLLMLAHQHQLKKTLVMPQAFVDMFAYVLQHESKDKFFLAELLTLPSEKYIGEQMNVVDVDAIHAAREFMSIELAKQLEPLFLKVYEANQTKSIAFDMKEVGKRQLKNRCLLYLALLPQHAALAMKQFKTALTSNMSDAQPALVALANLNVSEREAALTQFYQTWKDDALVMDKWFSIQATAKLPNTLENVKQLVHHAAFDIKNPNKVYALIGGFGQRNPVCFHAKTGAGYEFLREMVQQLDKLNPQVAARMVNPLTSLRRYDKERQGLMRKQLEVLLQDKKLSKDVYELVSKSLEEE